MSETEIELSDGSTFGIRPSGASEVEVSDGELLDNWLLVMSKAQRIARERREGKRPPRSPEQVKDTEGEILRLVALSRELRAKGPSDPEVDRLVELAQKER